MSATSKPLLVDLIDFVESFSRTFEIFHAGDADTQQRAPEEVIPSHIQQSLSQFGVPLESSSVPKISDKNALFENKVGPVHDRTDESQELHPLGRNKSASKLLLSSLYSELLILKNAVSLSVEAVNALMSMYIIQSFDGVLQDVLKPTQCAQLINAISLANLVSELDKQLSALKAMAEDHGRLEDSAVEHVQCVRADLIQASESIQSFAKKHIPRTEEKNHTLIDLEDRNSRMAFLISVAYADIKDQPGSFAHLISDQERCIIALKHFLEDKIEALNRRHHPNFHEQDGPFHHKQNWPPATLPAAEFATRFLSSILANFERCLSHREDAISSRLPDMDTKSGMNQLVAEPRSSEDADEMIDGDRSAVMYLGVGSFAESRLSSLSAGSGPLCLAPGAEHGVDMSMNFLRRSVDKRRDSAISFMSSIGSLGRREPQDEETVMGSRGMKSEEDRQREIEICDSQVVHSNKSGEEEEGNEQNGNDEDVDCTALQSHKKPTMLDDSRVEVLIERSSEDGKQDQAEILPPPDDAFAFETTPPPSCHAETPCEYCFVPESPLLEKHPNSSISTGWYPRPWLENILSMIARHYGTREAFPSTIPYPSSVLDESLPTLDGAAESGSYCGYVTWWHINREVHESELDLESTTSSESRQSWGAGSRSTEDYSID